MKKKLIEQDSTQRETAKVIPEKEVAFNRAMKIAHEIGEKNTEAAKRKAILQWCKEMKKVLK